MAWVLQSSNWLRGSLLCNAILGAILVFVVFYARAANPESSGPRAAEASIVDESSRPGKVEISVVNSADTSGEGSVTPLGACPPGWVWIPLPQHCWGWHVFEREQPQKLTSIAIAALEMDESEVGDIEALAIQLSSELKQLNARYSPASSGDPFEYHPPADVPVAEVDRLCKEFTSGAVEILGEPRGTALSDAALSSSTFLVEAYPKGSLSYRIRAQKEQQLQQLRSTGSSGQPIDDFFLLDQSQTRIPPSAP